MKPTQEQVEAANYILGQFFGPNFSREDLNWVAEAIAAHDAERDARWEALKVAAELEVRSCCVRRGLDPNECGKCRALHAALANLGAEEKPRILLVEDATLPPGEAELRGSKDTVRIKNIGAEEKR